MNAQGRHLVCHDHIATTFQRFSNVRCLLGHIWTRKWVFLTFPIFLYLSFISYR